MKKIMIAIVGIMIAIIMPSFSSAQWEEKLLPSSPNTSFWKSITEGGEGTARDITLLAVYKKAGVGEMTKSLIAYNVLSSLVVQPLKKEIGRPRPIQEEWEKGNSMPSAHAMSAFYCAYWLGKAHPNQKILFLGGATLVAISRTQLRVHYPSDVIVGGIIGYFGSAILDHTIDEVWKKIAKKEEMDLKIIPDLENREMRVAWQF